MSDIYLALSNGHRPLSLEKSRLAPFTEQERGRRHDDKRGDGLAELASLARGFLEAEGYEVSSKELALLVGRRAAIGEEFEFIYVWVADATDVRRREPTYLTALVRARKCTLLHSASYLSIRLRA